MPGFSGGFVGALGVKLFVLDPKPSSVLEFFGLEPGLGTLTPKPSTHKPYALRSDIQAFGRRAEGRRLLGSKGLAITSLEKGEGVGFMVVSMFFYIIPLSLDSLYIQP